VLVDHSGFRAARPLYFAMDATPVRSLFVFVPAAVATVLPKCPLCLLTIASALGIELPMSGRWLFPATLALLACSIALMARMATPSRRRSVLAIALMGGTCIVAGRLSAGPAALLLHVGAAALIVASIRASCRASCMSSKTRCKRGT
ncbi:MAG TPA: hypothetical protein VEK79_02980, partial [Thermoanaerobaculia bacterium]|nr:hypothetical protein [Thermoanaerobaculia bacterium]